MVMFPISGMHNMLSFSDIVCIEWFNLNSFQTKSVSAGHKNAEVSTLAIDFRSVAQYCGYVVTNIQGY